MRWKTQSTASTVSVTQLRPCFGSMPLPPLAFDADTVGGDLRGLIKCSNVMQIEGRHMTRGTMLNHYNCILPRCTKHNKLYGQSWDGDFKFFFLFGGGVGAT